jgi:voltage-gated potassium channel
MELLRKIVLESDTKKGKTFDLVIQLLIVLSIINFTLSTIKGKSESYYNFLNTFEKVTVIIFTVEYLLRVVLEKKKLKFIFSYFGLIDLIAIIPFYLSTGVDLRSLRALRLLRVFKFFRYSKTLYRISKAIKIAKQELILFFSLTCILLYLAAVGIYYFENQAQPEVFKSIFDSLWWAVATLTTVGYGDLYPITIGGRIFTFFILMIGLGIVSIPAGIIASAVSKAREEE